MTPASQTQPFQKVRWTIHDLWGFTDETKRYEIIDGELFVTRAPRLEHQDAEGNIYLELKLWNRETKLGKTVCTPGVIFSEADAVIPDVVWISNERMAGNVDEAGHFTIAPELVVEVLSKSQKDKRRDREHKLRLYSTEGVLEYWIADEEQTAIELYRRDQGALRKIGVLLAEDTLTSPLLPGFSCQVADLFLPI
ncbi:MAG: Uma2 family endonuclease [Cyanobacteria bacterium J06648_16]